MANEFKPDVGNQVLKSDSQKWIAKWQQERPQDSQSVFYGRTSIEEILKDPTVTGISFFFCRMTNPDKVDYTNIVLVGTQLDGKLVWNNNPPVPPGGKGGSNTYENSIPCPPYCTTA